MGFYLRKSLSFGPVRFNLSKSGIGVSAGVRGARVGVSATGRAYVHAGRSGLYFRQSLGSGRSSTTSRARTDSVQEGDVIQQATNVTYLPPSTPASDPLKDHLVRRKAAVAAFLLIPAAGPHTRWISTAVPLLTLLAGPVLWSINTTLSPHVGAGGARFLGRSAFFSRDGDPRSRAGRRDPRPSGLDR